MKKNVLAILIVAVILLVVISTDIVMCCDSWDDTIDLNPLYPQYQIPPFNISWGTAKNYSINGSGNNFQISSWVKNYGTQNTVAIFGSGIAESSNSHAWGGNFVSYANVSGATGIGTEINYGSMSSGGNAYGLIVVSAGDYATNQAIQIHSNTANSIPANGIYFNGGNIQPVTNSLITTSQNIIVPNGIDLSNADFSNNIALAINNADGIVSRNSRGDITDIIKLDESDVLWIGSGTENGISLVVIPKNSGTLRIQSLAGTGNNFACLDANGNLYRSSTACV